MFWEFINNYVVSIILAFFYQALSFLFYNEKNMLNKYIWK